MQVSISNRLTISMLILLALGCSETNFSSSDKNKNQGKNALPATAKDPNSSVDQNSQNETAQHSNSDNDPENIENADLSDSALPGDIEIKDGQICYKKIPQVNIGIALDTTASMDAQINSVKINLNSFFSRVKSIKLTGGRRLESVKVGLVTFKDSVEQKFALTADMDLLALQIASIRAGGGADLPEAGYRGAYSALHMLYNETKSLSNKTAVNVVLIISDTFSHDGGPAVAGFGLPVRHFESPSLKKAIASKLFKNILIYSAVPNSGGLTNVPFASPEAQWAALRSYWKGKNPDVTEDPGEFLGYPFRGETLLTALPDALRKRIKLCDR